MSAWVYTEDGRRRPFDPTQVPLDGCLLCGGSIDIVGGFAPSSAAMRAAVLPLRRHPVRPQREDRLPCLRVVRGVRRP